MYIKQIANTLRTFGECSLNTHEIACETLPNSPRPPRNRVRNTPSGVGDRFIAPVSLHNQIRTFVSPHTHIHITKYVFPHYQIRVFISPRTHLCITIPIYSFFVIYNIEYKTTQYSIYIHVNCINCFLGYFLIKIQNRALHSTLYICMHPNFVLTSGRNCVPIILPIPSVEPRFISPLYRFHTQNGGKKTRAHLISTPRNCSKLCMDRMICSHASHSIRIPFIEIALPSPGICTTLS